MDIDYFSAIVGVLSLLTALLVGWQIYETITIRNRIHKIISEEVGKHSTDITNEFNIKMADLYLFQIHLCNETKNYSPMPLLAGLLLGIAVSINKKENRDRYCKYGMDMINTCIEQNIPLDLAKSLIVKVLKILSSEYDEAYKILYKIEKPS